jgi:hypothetical protein
MTTQLGPRRDSMGPDRERNSVGASDTTGCSSQCEGYRLNKKMRFGGVCGYSGGKEIAEGQPCLAQNRHPYALLKRR